MSINAAIVAHLESIAAVTDIVGTKIYHQRAPQGSCSPLIVFNKISGIPYYHFGGRSGKQRATFQLDGYALTPAGATALETAIQHAMDTFLGTIAGAQIDQCHLIDTREMEEAPQQGTDAGEFRISMDYEIFYLEPVPLIADEED